ncbi:class F sortase [Micromonospora sp. WMMD812]|uniref:class F sortase n=1 Tax=Micromonospora sp. WMMD812 TaxID=3015152 RepID=UPI00248C11AB|nr:class F sortase [Micromonospora sp. WMMD812]WBB66752.1 class F sortase [Micromonospora sp. WMMD812]
MSPSSDRTTTRAGGRHGKPWRAAGAAVVLLLVAMTGAAMIGAGMKPRPAPRPPQPLAQTAPERTGPDEADQPGEGASAPTEPPRSALPRSAPTTITIPRIGVDAKIMPLGTNPDGTIQVPPLDQAQLAGWYEPGPSPGEVGNAVVVGHVDSAKLGPAVFFDLGAVQPGDTVTVNRADGRPVTFRVDSVRSYPKTSFPTELVYGPSDRPGLRVVTCGGQFDQNARSYLNNIIVFASLVD